MMIRCFVAITNRGIGGDTEQRMYRRDADRIACSLACMLAIIALVGLAGCGGSSPPAVQSSAQQSIVAPQQVTVSPATAQIAPGSLFQFSAIVTPGNAVNTVNWSVSGAGCSSAAACGSIDGTGRYTCAAFTNHPFGRHGNGNLHGRTDEGGRSTDNNYFPANLFFEQFFLRGQYRRSACRRHDDIVAGWQSLDRRGPAVRPHC